MIIVRDPRGHVVVRQTDHAAMCAELARSWGNERFGPLDPADDICLAAEQHELGWLEWERSPTLDGSTGLPFTVLDLDPAVHLPMQLDGPRELAALSPYAGLLASLKHASMYSNPSAVGLLRGKQRLIKSYLDESAALQAELRARLGADDAEIERNWRLVRTWDGLSHDLLLDRAPRTRAAVPAADGALVDLHLERRNGAHVLEPWPFGADRVEVHARGRLLEQTFSDQEQMRAALRDAPEVVLTYELAPA